MSSEVTLEAEVVSEGVFDTFPPQAKHALEDPREETFCHLVVSGEHRWKAWVTAFGTTSKNPSNAGNAGQARVLKRRHVQERIRYLEHERGARMKAANQELQVEVDREWLIRKTVAKLSEYELAGNHQYAFKYMELLARLKGAVGGGGQHLHLHEGNKDTRPGGEIVAGVVRELQSFFPGGTRPVGAGEDGDSGGGSDTTEG